MTQDASVIGFDNNPVTERLEPGLTTFAPPWEEVGFNAARSLLKWINMGRRYRPVHKVTDIPMVERGSVGPLPGVQ